MTHDEQAWRDYRRDVSATRRDALRKLAPSARTTATLAAYRAARNRTDWRKRIIIALAVADVLTIAAAVFAAL